MTKISRRSAIAGIATASMVPAAALPASGLEEVIDKHKAALAAYNAAGEVTGQMEASAVAIGKDALRAMWDSEAFKEATEAEHVASGIEMEVGQKVIAYPCRTLAEVVRKVAYIQSCPGLMWGSQEEDFEALVNSLSGLRG